MATRLRAKSKVRIAGFVMEFDGAVFKTRTLSKMMRQIANHRLDNGGDLTADWDQRVLAQIREKYPDAVAEETTLVSDIGVKYLGVASFLKTAHAFIANGSKFVDHGTALARAEICRSCPQASNMSACGICKQMVAELMFPVPEHFEFGERAFCGVCHCSLVHKVWLPDEVLAAGPKAVPFPNHCWARTTTDAEAHTDP